MKSAVTVDVEGDFGHNRETKEDPYESVDLLDKAVEPGSRAVTLFVTPDVVEHRPETVAKWVEGNATVGLHIHPGRLEVGDSDRLTEYDQEAITDLVARGCETFEEQLDIRPRFFRAGRWEYSPRMMKALGALGFDGDASLKPDSPREPYAQHGVRELPLSVYDNFVVRHLLLLWDVKAVPMTVDRFASSRFFEVSFRVAARRILATEPPYFMCSYHDYDLRHQQVLGRIRRFLSWLERRTDLVTVVNL